MNNTRGHIIEILKKAIEYIERKKTNTENNNYPWGLCSLWVVLGAEREEILWLEPNLPETMKYSSYCWEPNKWQPRLDWLKMKLRELEPKIIKLYRTGEYDFWSREILRDEKGRKLVMVDGAPHYTTDWDEPISPLSHYEIKEKD